MQVEISRDFANLRKLLHCRCGGVYLERAAMEGTWSHGSILRSSSPQWHCWSWLCPRGEQAGELQRSPGSVAVSTKGGESQPVLTGAGIAPCGYRIPEQTLEVYFSKLIHQA